MVTKCGRAAARAVKISAGSLARASTHAGHLRRLWRSRMLSVTLANRAGHALFRLAPLAVFVACFGSVGCRDAARVLGGSSHDAPVASVAASSESLSPAVSSEEKLADERPLKVPNGEAPRLSCAQARSIVAEVRRRLPAAPPSVSPHAFAELWTDWFDPHGLWSAAPDAPLSAAVQARSSALLAELEAGSVAGPCSVALSLAADSKHWVDGLRAVFEQARVEAPRVHFQRALSAINEPAFEDDAVSHPARELASDLGAARCPASFQI